MIYLIGMMGNGKTTLGKQAAERLGLPFYDTDSMIAERSDMTIPEIFSTYGEKHFRDTELSVIKEVSRLPFGIVSTGGGAVLREENMALMHSTGEVLWLHRNINETAADVDIDNLPVLKGDISNLYRVYKARLPLYKKHGKEVHSGIDELCAAIAEITKDRHA